MTPTCKNCGKELNSRYKIYCSCGTFCSVECSREYHHKIEGKSK
jgi:hypothetical protein